MLWCKPKPVDINRPTADVLPPLRLAGVRCCRPRLLGVLLADGKRADTLLAFRMSSSTASSLDSRTISLPTLTIICKAVMGLVISSPRGVPLHSQTFQGSLSNYARAVSK